jgi:hypothetical protein
MHCKNEYSYGDILWKLICTPGCAEADLGRLWLDQEEEETTTEIGALCIEDYQPTLRYGLKEIIK